ncbi:MAG: hypothetical protein U1F76_25990 [Candidatus Competibacteraceae bacterium]
MKTRPLFSLLAILITALIAIGCSRTDPVQNIDNAPITVTSGKNYTLTDVRNAIVRAGVGLGWQMQDVAPGHLVGTLNIRSHMAQVDIKYNTKAYSITYRDSSNLNYDGTKIHSNYNGWIQNLNSKIMAQLSGIGA